MHSLSNLSATLCQILPWVQCTDYRGDNPELKWAITVEWERGKEWLWVLWDSSKGHPEVVRPEKLAGSKSGEGRQGISGDTQWALFMESTHVSLIGHWPQTDKLPQIKNRIDILDPIKLQNRGYPHDQLEVMPNLLLHVSWLDTVFQALLVLGAEDIAENKADQSLILWVSYLSKAER